jgi:hypothetical protein
MSYEPRKTSKAAGSWRRTDEVSGAVFRELTADRFALRALSES